MHSPYNLHCKHAIYRREKPTYGRAEGGFTYALTSKGDMGQFVEGKGKRHYYNLTMKECIFHSLTQLIKLFNFSFSLEIKC